VDRHREDEVDRLLDRLATLSDDEVALLAAAWQEENDVARQRAWQTVKPSLRHGRLDRVLDRARSEVGRWAAVGRSDFSGIGGLLGQPVEQANARMRAAPAVLDAVAAILAEDVLDREDWVVLSRPWKSATGD
jgi:hypothetical protein